MSPATKRGEPRVFLQKAIHYNGEECLIWPFSCDNHGYGQISIVVTKGHSIPRKVSRLVCEAVNGEAPSTKHHAAHSCGKGASGCVAGTHLLWATAKENQADKIRHGTQPAGEDHPLAILTWKKVFEIRRLLSRGVAVTVIARKFRVTHGAIGHIKRGARWSCP